MSKGPVRGVEEIARFLSAFPAKLQKNALGAGLRAAGAILRDEARLKAPRDSGEMASNIKTGGVRQEADGAFAVSVRLTGEHAYLGLFHEYGVTAHNIGATKRRGGRIALRKADPKGDNRAILAGPMKIGDRFVSGIVVHPGHAAHPFMRPALDAKADEAVDAIAQRVRAYVEGKTVQAPSGDEAP